MTNPPPYSCSVTNPPPYFSVTYLVVTMATADVQIPEGSMPDQKEISGLPEIRIEIQMYTPERMEKIKKQINGKSLFVAL